MSAPPQRWSRDDYERAAREYCERLPPEHYMEATPQATQRRITLASFAALNGRVPGLHLFNELLVQEFVKGSLRQVVPDNMVVLGELEPRERNYYCPEEEGRPVFWALEYVSPNTRRKDYVRNREIYERELEVPYYMIFDPDRELAMLLRLGDDGQYAMAAQDAETERYLLPELEMELGLVGGWVRYWHKGEMVPLPAELRAQTEEMAEQLAKERELRQEVEAERDELLAERAEMTARRDELLSRQSEQLTRQGELLNRQSEQLGQQGELLANQGPVISQQAEQLQQLDARAQQHQEQQALAIELLTQQQNDLRQREAEANSLAALLRSVLGPKARQAGRQDILDQLPATADAGTLQRWLAELGP